MGTGLIDLVTREIGNKSREFYEFVLPPTDMQVRDGRITVIIDLPGFDKKEMRLCLDSNILSISAKSQKRTRTIRSCIVRDPPPSTKRSNCP